MDKLNKWINLSEEADAMADRQEFARNLAELGKCKRIYTVVFYFFIVSGAFMLIYSFTNLLSIGLDGRAYLATAIADDEGDSSKLMTPYFFLLLLIALPVVPLISFLGIRVALRQHDLSAFFDICISAGGIIVLLLFRNWSFFRRVPICLVVYVVYMFLTLGASVAGMKANIKYHWLEGQEGFPLFNERFYDYDQQSKDWDENNPYKALSEQRKLTASDHMSEVPELPADKLEELYGLGSQSEKQSNIKLSGHKDK